MRASKVMYFFQKFLTLDAYWMVTTNVMDDLDILGHFIYLG